ncbi:hypothetical protein LXL04_028994 [Taraxacum kok-saghyz]
MLPPCTTSFERNCKKIMYYAGLTPNIIEIRWSDFKHLIGNLAELSLSTECIYFCPAQERFSNGLNALQNDCDYNAFLETAYGGKQLVNVYIDCMDEPLFEWLEKEDPKSDNEAVEKNDEEDVDSQLYDNEKWEHEEDEEVVSTKRTTNDHFINKLYPIEFEDQKDEGPQRTIFHVHNSTKDWKGMTPVIGMKFANPGVLKFSLSNYAVANGNAKKFALSEIEGNLREHYSKLWDYGSKILRANPGSHVQICVEPEGPGMGGWKGAEGSFFYGCFLKGICRGELIAAVGRDANNSIYPLAWVVINVKSKDTWKWFLDNLMDDIGGGLGNGLILISDGHKGLMEVVKERAPKAEHRLNSYVAGYQQFEVIQGNERYAVDLSKRICGCRSWQISGIPCVHGMAAIASQNLDPELYVAACFKKEKFLQAYAYIITPLNDSSLWPTDPDITLFPLPPKRRRLPGRPAIKMKRDKAEKELSGKRREKVSKGRKIWHMTFLKKKINKHSIHKNEEEDRHTSLMSKEKINVLDAINLAVSPWRNVKQESIANYFRHCKICTANPTGSNDLNDVTSGEDIRELENLITGMHYRHKMDVNELLDYPSENNECYKVQSNEEIIADTVQNSVDDEVDDDSVPLEPVTRKEALQAATTLHNFLLQYENTVPQLLSAIGRFKDELNIDLKFTKKTSLTFTMLYKVNVLNEREAKTRREKRLHEVDKELR